MIPVHRRTWVEISTQAFNNNITCYKNIIGPSVMISLVVKANAYGHGITQIAHMAENNDHIHMLDTASLSEALILRGDGIKKPILVMGIMDDDPVQAIVNNIDVMVSNEQEILELNSHAQVIGKKCNIHIKVDTGLGRFGVLYNDAVALVKYAQTLPYIYVKGICSHFAEASSQDQSYTQLQYNRFIDILRELQENHISIPYRHITNSAATTTYDLSMLSMIRIAAGAYGLYPSEAHRERTVSLHPEYRLKQILSWHTRVCHIKTLPEQTYVGYDRTYTTTKRTTIALLPIGYSDGYDKRLSNKAQVYFPHARMYAPVIGKVAMNVTTIDISQIPDVHIGTEVILVGPWQEIAATRLAEISGCHNPREITLHIHPSIVRVYTPHDNAINSVGEKTKATTTALPLS
jgi:alanine racemase